MSCCQYEKVRNQCAATIETDFIVLILVPQCNLHELKRRFKSEMKNVRVRDEMEYHPWEFVWFSGFSTQYPVFQNS